MSKTHLVIPDIHAHPDYHNERASYLSKLILDLKPDTVVSLGDSADLPSLSGFDKGKASFYSKNYEKDIISHLDFQDKMWHDIKKSKKKLPRRVVLEGNHDHRIKRALEYDPHLSGARFGISFSNLELPKYYDDVVEYEGNTPGLIEIDGVTYAHYLISGVMGRPISGEHHAYSLLAKNHSSCTVGHSHLLDFSVKRTTTGRTSMGLVAGVYQDYDNDWAGNTCKLWWRGVVVKRGVDKGNYDPQFISLESLKEEYGR